MADLGPPMRGKTPPGGNPTTPPPKPSDAARSAQPVWARESVFPMPDMEPGNPPAPARLVSLTPRRAMTDVHSEPGQARQIPPPPPPTPGLGRPETTRKEARWERAITWLLSRGDR